MEFIGHLVLYLGLMLIIFIYECFLLDASQGIKYEKRDLKKMLSSSVSVLVVIALNFAVFQINKNVFWALSLLAVTLLLLRGKIRNQKADKLLPTLLVLCGYFAVLENRPVVLDLVAVTMFFFVLGKLQSILMPLYRNELHKFIISVCLTVFWSSMLASFVLQIPYGPEFMNHEIFITALILFISLAYKWLDFKYPVQIRYGDPPKISLIASIAILIIGFSV